jgi:hypothetical protein
MGVASASTCARRLAVGREIYPSAAGPRPSPSWAAGTLARLTTTRRKRAISLTFEPLSQARGSAHRSMRLLQDRNFGRHAAGDSIALLRPPLQNATVDGTAPLDDRKAMIELILTVCALNAPIQCDEQRLQFAS